MLTALSVLGYLGTVGALAALAVRGELFSAAPAAIALQAGAFALLVWARVTFGRRSYHVAANPTAGGLVTTGPYRYVRHPIYAAVTGFAWVGVAAHPSWPAIACGVLVLASALVRIHAEEALVVAQYPEYAEYAARTWRMLPYVF